MAITPELVGAVSLGIGGIITAWFGGREKLKKALFENSNGDGTPPERRKNGGVSKEAFDTCKAARESVENTLTIGQREIEKELKAMGEENKADFQKMRTENKQDFQRLYDKIDSKCN